LYRALYRKWRPKTFDEIVGQDHITSILKKQCEENKVSHAYLFCGSRGTGKTSSAKILAKAVNCERPVNGNPCNACYSCQSIDNASATDVLEIDAASNNRVADVRELIDEVVYPPSLLKKRVYIIDEVHMLSDSAFNALLKTLEEPPEYVLFILATTELNQLPPTIVSRCMRFDFKRIEPDMLTKRLHYVAEQEGIRITEEAEKLIAKLADGAARDALSLLDACSAGRGDSVITLEDVQAQLGITNNDTIIYLFSAIVNRNIPEALGIVQDVHKSSKDLSVFLADLIAFVRDMLIAKSIPSESEKYLKEQFFFSATASDQLSGMLKAFTTETLLYYSSVLEDALNTISRFTVNKKTFFELTVIKLCDLSLSDSPKALLARIAELEKKVAEGVAGKPEAPSVRKPSVAPIPNPPVEKEKKPKIEPIPSDAGEKPFKALPELLQELKDHPDVCSFLRMARITEKGDAVMIYTDLIGKHILTQPAAKAAIESAVKTVTGKDKQVQIQEKTGKEENSSPSLIDEIEI